MAQIAVAKEANFIGASSEKVDKNTKQAQLQLVLVKCSVYWFTN